MDMIKLVGVNKYFYTREMETRALRDVDLHIGAGEFVAIMGPSGCGKSTLLHIMGLLDSPSSGRLEIAGQDVAGLGDKALARLRNQEMGFVFQKFHLIPALNVVDNVEVPLLYRPRVSARERREKALAVLEKVGLSSRVKHFPGQLSGGQSQRVAIARTIVGSPRIIYADEPTGNLDSRMSGEIMDLLVRLNAEGTTIVMVTHDPRVAERTGRVIRMLDGQLI